MMICPAACRIAYRDSWAMIGVKGAAIGTVPELHTKRFSGYAEVRQEAPSVHLVDGFHFYFTDHLNSTRMLDDWDPGQTEMQVDYFYPFGEINTQSGGGEGTHYKFTGYEEDTGIELHYAKARFYSPELGRFLTPDLAGQYFSPYVYVGNRPLVYVDPDGEFGFLAIAAGALFASWVAGNVIEGFSQAFGNPPANVPGLQVPLYGNPGVTDMFPPFLGYSNVSFGDDDKYPKEVWLGAYISLEELERRRREKLAGLREWLWRASVVLSGSAKYGPLPANNPVYQFYSIGGAVYGAGTIIAGGLESGRFISGRWGLVRANPGMRVSVSSLRPVCVHQPWEISGFSEASGMWGWVLAVCCLVLIYMMRIWLGAGTGRRWHWQGLREGLLGVPSEVS